MPPRKCPRFLVTTPALVLTSRYIPSRVIIQIYREVMAYAIVIFPNALTLTYLIVPSFISMNFWAH
jgi:hypothetical protein